MDVSESNSFPLAHNTKSYLLESISSLGWDGPPGFLRWFFSSFEARAELAIAFKQSINLRKPMSAPVVGRLLEWWTSFTLPKSRAYTVMTQGDKYPEFSGSKMCFSVVWVGVQFIFPATAVSLWMLFYRKLILQWLSPCACFLTSFWFISPPGIEMEIVDSCQENNGGCSHHCEHTIAGPRCSCDEGYHLDFDGKTCSGNSWQMQCSCRRREEVRRVSLQGQPAGEL